ncbi:auxin-responsive protein IAA11-like [Malania oleifera]|uniref:auxin-responsive protein IAA11-like n=1 Tax=Malania oleifera TaxID=397392 RepID=UPI0025ADDB79|nr:auxin-responsive protein IAA11-like [Malania oleifera]
MEGVLGAAGGGRASSGGSSGGSVSTVSKEEMVEQDNPVMSTEVSSYPDAEDDSELDLGLGLSLGGGGGGGRWAQQPKIFIVKDFRQSPSSSSSSSSLNRANLSVGTKRPADSVATANGISQVVGWPPIRSYRMNSLCNQAKSSGPEELSPVICKGKCDNAMVEKTFNGSEKSNGKAKENRHLRTSLFVKVKMDGIPIGRKVDLSSHSCYETLAQTLEHMFHPPSTTINAMGSSGEEDGVILEASRPPKLLDGSYEFVLTYEDKDGDWMLVGDVPWGMFVSSVKKLRIMRTSEANGLAPRFQERNERQRSRFA